MSIKLSELNWFQRVVDLRTARTDSIDSLKREPTHSFTNRTSKQLSPFTNHAMLSINHLNVLKPTIWRGFSIKVGATVMFGIGTMPKKHNEFERSNAPIVNRNAMLINTQQTHRVTSDSSVFESPRTGKNQNKLVV